MEVRVLFFGMLKEVAGRESDTLALPANATVQDLLRHYLEADPRFGKFLSAIAISVNQEYAPVSTRLKLGDEVALLPPVSGGCKTPSESQRPLRTAHAEIVRDKIEASRIIEDIKNPSDGAAVVFEGMVRNHTRNRRTLYLEYESYEEMALKQMESLAEQAMEKFKVRDIRIVHRLGRLEIGEISVLIVVASEHRGAAFDACRWLIDTLKRTVPIWKKEHFEDGAVWADGEPFPAEIPRGEGTH